jgi:hypothetical protein
MSEMMVVFSLQIQLKSFLVVQVSRERKAIIVILYNRIVVVVSVVAWVHAVSSLLIVLNAYPGNNTWKDGCI